MPTTVNNTIGSGGAYSTIPLWEDATDYDLVAADEIHYGLLLNQQHDIFGGITVFAGATTDATRYRTLKCNTGASFKDNANVRTNALFPSAANGALINDSGAGGYGPFMSFAEDFFQLEGVQIVSLQWVLLAGFPPSTNAARQIFKQNIYKANGSFQGVLDTRYTSHVNCLIIATTTYASNVEQGSRYYGCTFVAPSGISGPCRTDGYTSHVGTTHFYNCAFFGWTSLGHNLFSGWDHGYCATDVSGTPFAPEEYAYPGSNIAGLTMASQFESATNDFRAKAGNGLQHGLPDATFLSVDISGTARDATNPTIGCWETTAAVTALAAIGRSAAAARASVAATAQPQSVAASRSSQRSAGVGSVLSALVGYDRAAERTQDSPPVLLAGAFASDRAEAHERTVTLVSPAVSGRSTEAARSSASLISSNAFNAREISTDRTAVDPYSQAALNAYSLDHTAIRSSGASGVMSILVGVGLGHSMTWDGGVLIVATGSVLRAKATVKIGPAVLADVRIGRRRR
jgi:hypothetical protein